MFEEQQEAQWDRERGGGVLETNNIVPCTYSMDFHFKFKGNGEKLQCFEKRKNMKQLFFSDEIE